MTTKQEFLAGLPIFKNLDTYAIEALAAICPEYEYGPGAVVAYQRDVADSLYIVRTGRLFARNVDQDGIARVSRAYLPGEYFDDIWLFAPGVHPATVKGTDEGRVIIINNLEFLHFLEENPAAIRDLAPKVDDVGNAYGLSAVAWEECRKLLTRGRSRDASAGLQADELLEYYARRSKWFLFLSILPAILMLLLVPIIFLLLPFDVGLVRIFRWLIPGLLLLGGVALLLFRWIDWRNDYFIITNKHLLHREFSIRTFNINLVKIPVSQIQTVEILKPTLLSNLFDIGTARVTTAANVGVVTFDNIDDPILVKQTLERLAGRVRALNAAEEMQTMRRSLEDHFEVQPHLRAVVDSSGEIVYSSPSGSRARGSPSWLNKRFGWRVVDGDVTTYRKSIFILAGLILWPVVGFIIVGLIAWLLVAIGFPSRIVFLFTAIVIAIDLFGLIWQVENWRNDTFQVTDKAVIDIDRKPFGFSESRKQAPIANIQNITAERPGLLATLFNYGFVKVETAGAQADIMFDYVVNPSVIQSDIFERLDNYKKNQRTRDGQTRRQEYAVLLDVFRQALEEDRIPQRMPSSNEEEFEEL